MKEQDRSGTSIGDYTLERLLGRGGMGEVYVARDGRLGRTVALKILRPEVAEDREHRGRFEREAKALAALKHPGIVTIYALEEVGDDAFFVMDLVEGRTLSKLIESEGPLSVERILELAIPISDAIAAAHKQGIAHRDIKPDNIMVGPRGEVTVLDFGLAKNRGVQISNEVGGSTQGLTMEGRIFGTVNYMAPEQVEAGRTSLATDVFALGVVIYEMATGQLPFQGDSTVSILSSILKEQPVALSSYDNPVPLELERLIQRCLEKDPDRRWQSALDVRNELELVQEAIASGQLEAPAGRGTPARRGALGWVCAALLAGCCAFLSQRWLSDGAEETLATGASDAGEIWAFDCLTSAPGMESSPSISPNGEFITYSMRSSEAESETSIYLHRIGGNRPIELTPDMEGDEVLPRFSPDGERIAFRSGSLGMPGAIYIMGATGESRRRLDVDGYGLDWSPDGKQLVCSTEGYPEPHGRPTHGELLIVDVESGESRMIYPGDAVDPRWSPDGQWILFWTVGFVDEEGRFEITGRRDLGIIRADGTDARLLTDDLEFDWRPAWGQDGASIVFSSNRGGPMGLWELDFDPSTGEVSSTPRPIPAPSTYAGDPDVTRDGRMIAYVDGMGSYRILRAQIDLETLELTGIPEVVVGGGVAGDFDVSPDGELLVMTGGPMRADDIYVSREDGSGMRQVTDDAFRNLQPRFGHRGDRVHFFSNRNGVYEGWRCGVDGGGFVRTTDGWRLITTPTVHPQDGTMATVTAATESWYVLPADARELPLSDAEAKPKVDEEGRWFSPVEYSSDGTRLLGIVNAKGESGPLRMRWFGLYMPETDEYKVFEDSLATGAFTVSWDSADRKILVGNREGIWAFDPDTEERSAVIEFDGGVHSSSPEVVVTESGYIYYSTPQNERDIWIARRAPRTALTKFGQ